MNYQHSAPGKQTTYYFCCLAFSQLQQQSTHSTAESTSNKEEQKEQSDFKTWKGSIKLPPSWGLQSTKHDL